METIDKYPGDLRALLAMSLRATSSDAFVLSQNLSVRDGESSRSRLVQGILFSRRFILSYQAVLLLLLLVFTIRHWASRFQALRRQRQRHRVKSNTEEAKPKGGNPLPSKTGSGSIENVGSGVTSSSSTIQGSCPSPKGSIEQGASERTPLLPAPEIVPSRSIGIRLVRIVRASLMYQPPPIPLVNKILPSNGTALLVLALLGLQAFYVFYRMPLSIPTLFVFADRTSLLFVANLPLLYLFAAKNQPIKILTGYSYESLNIYHRRLGEVMCLLALLHSVGMIGVWYTILRPVGFTLARFLLSKIILLGLGAFVAYELIYFTSLGSFRQRWYELFLFLHVSLQVVALVLVWFHHHGSRPYVGVALAIFLVDRLVYRMALKLEYSRASLEMTEDGDTVVLRTEVPLVQKHRFLRTLVGNSISKGWKTTEHVFLTVSALSSKHMIQTHPFTIASKAPQAGDSEAELKLIIRPQDGFSGDLLRYARGHASVKIRLDGPYGSQTAVQLLQQCDLSVIVAGGSGIAVAMPLLWALHDVRSATDPESHEDGKPLSQVVLIWVIRDEAHMSWVGTSELHDLYERGLEVILPPSTAKHGKPDVSSILKSWVSARNPSITTGDAKIGVVCSAPDRMNRAVRNTCAKLLAQGHDIAIEVEEFGW
ncbi:MAG: hypothetical protein L6R40_007403 [Gallowayella cf. fulva]|nr:MAG: hypothetical protein L6R40_007403 [Xanthomendoza cf. fulva]